MEESQNVKTQCRKAMVEHWGSVDIPDSEIHVSVISGGLSNRNYLVKLSSMACALVAPSAFTSVFVRVFGDNSGDLGLDEKNDLYCLSTAGSIGIAPRVLGTFEGGRCEEFFVEGRTWSVQDLRDEKQLLCLARALADLHSQPLLPSTTGRESGTESPTSVLGSDTNNIFAERLRTWGAGAVRAASVHTAMGGRRAALVNAACPVLLANSEVPWFLDEVLPLLNSPVVLCHGDINEGNMLDCQRDGGTVLRLIDFEFGGPSHRGFEIANTFWECAVDNQGVSFPGFIIDADQYPNAERQRAFCEAYLGVESGTSTRVFSSPGDCNDRDGGENKVLPPIPPGEEERGVPQVAGESSEAKGAAKVPAATQAGASAQCANDGKGGDAAVEALMWEAECFGLASHLQWALWGVLRAPSPRVAAVTENSDWSYLDYAAQRASLYFALKAKLLPRLEQRRAELATQQQGTS